MSQSSPCLQGTYNLTRRHSQVRSYCQMPQMFGQKSLEDCMETKRVHCGVKSDTSLEQWFTTILAPWRPLGMSGDNFGCDNGLGVVTLASSG